MVLTAAKLQVEVGYADKGANAGLDKLDKKVKDSAKNQREFAKATHQSADALKVVGFAGAAAGAALGAAFTAVAIPATQFEQTMSGVKAVSGATGDEMKSLSGLALQLGKDTVFSATEAGKGIEELIKGGIQIGDVMGGAASAALNLASAGAVPLTVAAEQMADAMNIFGLKGTEAAHVADLIAGAANASSMTVTDFGFAMKMAGAVAKISGQNIDSTATAISVLAQAGLKGSDAGTSLKTMMLNLQPTTKTQIGMFKELGLLTADNTNLFIDQTGKMKPMAEIAQILQEHTKGLTAAQKTLSLEIAFGTDAIRAAAIMSEAGAEGFAKMTAEMSKVTALEVARERLNNLAGDMEQFKGSMETGAIMIGSLFTPALRGAAKGLTDMLNSGIESLGGLQAHIDALVQNEGLSQWDAMLFAVSDQLRAAFGPETALLFEGFTNQVSLAGEMITGFFKSSGEGAPSFVESVAGAFNSIGRSIDEFFDSLGNIIIVTALTVRAVGAKFDELGTWVRSAFDRLGTAISDAMPFTTAAAQLLGGAIVDGIKSALTAGFAAMGGWFGDRLNDLIQAGADAIRAHSPSEEAEEVIGEPIALGIIAGIEGGLRANQAVAVKALDGFMKDLGSSTGTFAVDFGKTGGDIASNLAIAIRDNTPQAGQAVGRALSKLVEDLGTNGIENWRQLGEDLAGALHEAMVTGTEESILAVHALIAENVGLINSAKEAAKAEREVEKAWKPGQGFFGAVTEVARDDSWVTQFGEAGSRAVSAFTAAWEGDHNAEAKAANAVQQMIKDARKVGITDANETGGAIIDALGMALQNGDEVLRGIGLEALQAFGQRLETAKAGVKDASDAIKKMVEDGLSDMKRLQQGEQDKIDVQRERDKIETELTRRQREIRSRGGANMGRDLAEAGVRAEQARQDLELKARQQRDDRQRKADNDARLAAEKVRLTGSARLPAGVAPAMIGPLGPAPGSPPPPTPGGPGDGQGLLEYVAALVNQLVPPELHLSIEGEEIETVVTRRRANSQRARTLA